MKKMKKLNMKQFITMLLAIWLVSGCQKETASDRDISGNEKSSLATSETPAIAERTAGTADAVTASKSANRVCTICSADSKVFNLLDLLKTIPLKEGSNTVSDLGNGIKAIAKVEKGQLVQWVLQDKSGKEYLPQSTEESEEQSSRLGAPPSHIWLVCTTTSCGTYCISVVWEWLDKNTHL